MRTTILSVLIVAVLSLAAGSARAQQQTAKVPRIGILGLAYPSSPFLQSFRQGLRELGYIEGQNIILETRSSRGDDGRLDERLNDLAAEMVRLQVDVIVAQSTLATYAAMSATKTIPIVMASTGDPVASGMVASLERPRGNVTGVSGLPTGLGGKMLELLKDTVPGVSRVAVLWNEGPEKIAPAWKAMRKGVEVAARSLGVELQALEVRRPGDLAGAFRAATTGRADAFIALPGVDLAANGREIAELALKSRLPGIFWRADFAEAGGLIAYGLNRFEQSRRAAYFVDKILRGAKPAELPVETPMRFELVINLKTAKEIGITIPPSVLAWADRVIK
jgi:putative ABC transport system substrate-binding protein